MFNIFHRLNVVIEKKLFGMMSNSYRIKRLRKLGVKIGEGCIILNKSFSTEPYLIEIGDHVGISSGVNFITHDGGVWSYRHKYPHMDNFGRIKIGSNTFIGINSIILPNTEIGENCIVGAGAVVRGKIPDNSVIMGNPAKVIMKSSFLETLYVYNKNTLQIKNHSAEEKKKLLIEHFKL